MWMLFLVSAHILPVQADAGNVPDQITIAAVGDVMMGSDFPGPLLPQDGGKSLLRDAKPFLQKADIAMANLEGPFCDGGSPAKPPKAGVSYLFRIPPQFAVNLKGAGVDMVSLANNHALDFGPYCHQRTKTVLKDAGMTFSSKKGEVAEFDIRGSRVGVIALSFGGPPRSIVYP
jgi:poly-gamma-glutamate capsule biosynthesis protein CapA/YwtB (metallophosphatase superfamily)